MPKTRAKPDIRKNWKNTNHGSLPIDSLDFSGLSKAQATLFREKWISESWGNSRFLGDQILRIRSYYDSMGPSNGFYLTWNHLEGLFRLNKSSLQRRIASFSKYGHQEALSPGGRRRKLSLEQEEEVYEYIKSREALHSPLEPVELGHWISNKFSVTLSKNWVLNWVEQKANSPSPLFMVTAKPLEKARATVTVEQLVQWADEVRPRLEGIDPRFCFNIDETSDQPRSEAKAKTVVSTSNVGTIYEVTRAAGHVTYLVGIGLTGTTLRTMAIVQTKTVHGELAQFDLPDNEFGLVTSSASAYINEELFLRWVEKIWTPHIEGLRRQLQKPEQTALLLLDGASAHLGQKAKELFVRCNTRVVELVPHTSHLTQPLDLVIFAAYKSIKSSMTIPANIKNAQSMRMMQNLKAIARSTDWITVRNSWAKAGWTISKPATAGEPPKIHLDISKVLEHDQAPVSETKLEHETHKRLGVFRGRTKGDRKREEDQEILKVAKKVRTQTAVTQTTNTESLADERSTLAE